MDFIRKGDDSIHLSVVCVAIVKHLKLDSLQREVCVAHDSGVCRVQISR